jgi:hypothetical protein
MNNKIYASAKVANMFRPYYPDSIFNNTIEGEGKEMETEQGSSGGDKSFEDAAIREVYHGKKKGGYLKIRNKQTTSK